jgi:hypothetical protein
MACSALICWPGGAGFVNETLTQNFLKGNSNKRRQTKWLAATRRAEPSVQRAERHCHQSGATLWPPGVLRCAANQPATRCKELVRQHDTIPLLQQP